MARILLTAGPTRAYLDDVRYLTNASSGRMAAAIAQAALAAPDCRGWLAGDRLSLADVALVAYTRVAPEGGFDLAEYPAVQAWVERVEAALPIRPWAPL